MKTYIFFYYCIIKHERYQLVEIFTSFYTIPSIILTLNLSHLQPSGKLNNGNI